MKVKSFGEARNEAEKKRLDPVECEICGRCGWLTVDHPGVYICGRCHRDIVSPHLDY